MSAKIPRQRPYLHPTVLAPDFPSAAAWLPPLRLQTGPQYWPLAILLSLLLHGLLGWWGVPSPLTPTTVKEKVRTTRISFQHEQPVPTPPVITQPPPLPPPPMASAPKPMVKPSLPRPAPVKAARPVPEPEPAASQAVQITPPEKAATTLESPSVPPPNPSEKMEARRQFMAKLFAHLDAHKEYSGSARRRRLEGQVQVSFTLFAADDLGDLQLSGAQPLLREAARKSLARAMPLPKPPAEVDLPLNIIYTMDFRLR